MTTTATVSTDGAAGSGAALGLRLRVRRRCCGAGHLLRAHHSARTHSGSHPSAGIHHRAAAVTPAVGAVGSSTQEEPGEEDQSNDEYDTGDDPHPGQQSIRPTGPASAIVISAPLRIGGRFGRFWCLRHGGNDATYVPYTGMVFRP